MTDEAKLIVDTLRECAVATQCSKCVVICEKECLFTVAAKMIESLSAELEATEAIAALARGLEVERDQLKARLEHVEYERDAAVMDLEACCPCEVCTRLCTYDKVNAYDECADFEWRGVKEGKTNVDYNGKV